MRQIGHIADEKQAHVFGNHLVANRIRNEIEAEDKAWAIWILDEEQVMDAKARLERFRANPASLEFLTAGSEAAKARDAEARDLADYNKRVRTGKSLFPKIGGYGVGPLTFALICICGAVAVYSKLGNDHEWLRRLLLADPEFADRTFLAQVRAGEYWRLITPIFIHFGPAHLLFNMMALYQFGCMIEARRGTFIFALLVVVTGALPMVAQYIMVGPGYVGGMSGAIYGLAGYIWMQGKFHRASGLYLDRQNIQWLLVWLVICYTGMVGNIANTAHVTGLVIGMVWGGVSAFFASRKPE